MYKAIKENKIIAVNDSGEFPCLVYDEVVEDNQHQVADFVMVESEDNFALMKKRRYGNILIQVVCLILALSVSMLFLFINVGYFIYSYLWASPHVLITTEKVGEDGEKLEFDSMDDVLNKANAIL